MRAPFSFWAAIPEARVRSKCRLSAPFLIPSSCRFAALCPDRSPRHRTQLASWRSGRICSRGIALDCLWHRGCGDCIACRRCHRICPPVKPCPDRSPRRLVRGTAFDRPVHRALIWSALSETPHANGTLTRFSSCAAMSMAAPQVVWDSENRKTFHRATFLRLATVASPLSEDKSAKPQVIGRTMAYFRFAGEGRGC